MNSPKLNSWKGALAPLAVPWNVSKAIVPPASGTEEVQVSLMQGEIHCSAEPRVLVTVLGSCVAVCLWDKVRGAGGMNHFVLPNDRNGENSARYGDVAIDELLAGLTRLGCRVTDLQAKVFGGAAVLPCSGGRTVGFNNVELALQRLRRENIRITAQRTGGILGQQIRFHTRSGEVYVRYIPAGARGAPREPNTMTPNTLLPNNAIKPRPTRRLVSLKQEIL